MDMEEREDCSKAEVITQLSLEHFKLSSGHLKERHQAKDEIGKGAKSFSLCVVSLET